MAMLLWMLLATAGETAEGLATRLGQAYRAGGDSQVDFTQVYTDQIRHKTRSEHGSVWLKADGRLRWRYAGDEPKLFVYDGKHAYFSEPDSGQVTIFEDFARSPLFTALQILWGGGDLQQNFALAFAAPQDQCPAASPGQQTLCLRPKQSLAALDHACLLIDSRPLQVRAARLIDPMGNITDYRLANLQTHRHLDDAQFVFHVDKGVSVLRAPQEPAGGH
ncbi:MAG: outer membrane lipoprotein carrier protein LolA [Deltaproteobacteria bacterium]|nr:MAG: outer membrane lipoprotein carrier protein LolA [Deltaproteobacteria bacterium]